MLSEIVLQRRLVHISRQPGAKAGSAEGTDDTVCTGHDPLPPSRSQNAILKTNQGSALCRIVAPQRSLLHRPVELMPACGGKYSGSGALTTSPSASSPIICWWQQQPHHRQHQRLHHNHAQTTRTTSGLPAAVRTHALANAALRPSQCGATNPWLRAEDLQA